MCQFLKDRNSELMRREEKYFDDPKNLRDDSEVELSCRGMGEIKGKTLTVLVMKK